ncbi:MAG: DNA primase small subunit domain-containing protein [Candidatus Hodarchaeota archaeon]
MSENELAFIERKFTEYYSQEKIVLPTQTGNREFGFIPFREKMMIRHRSFKTLREVTDFILAISPAHVYYSAAYYESPEESMNRKKWLRADLIFDIDLDHLDTPCKKHHELWICDNCQKASTQPNGECPYCSSRKMKKEAWLCDICLEVAKTETLRLLDFLIVDFGFQPNTIELCFSGHRGYHVHVNEKEVTLLDQTARKEIVDYILGTGLKIEYHGLGALSRKTAKRISGPTLTDYGWSGRIAKGIYDFLLSTPSQQLEEIEGRNKPFIRRISANKEEILSTLSRRNSWGLVKGMGMKTWQRLVEYGIEKQASNIDTVVTTDIHRLIRIPQSLHGKTGLKVTQIPLNSLEKFDPLKEAIAFQKDHIEVFVLESHQFRLGNEVFGPYKQEIVELPTAAGIYLLCKKVAKLHTKKFLKTTK